MFYFVTIGNRIIDDVLLLYGRVGIIYWEDENISPNLNILKGHSPLLNWYEIFVMIYLTVHLLEDLEYQNIGIDHRPTLHFESFHT